MVIKGPILTTKNALLPRNGTARFSLYVSPYLVAGQGGKYTKHIYIGSQRIVSKLGDLASYGADPRRIPYAGNKSDEVTVDYKAKYSQQLQSIKNNYKAFGLPYNGEDNDDYVNGQVCPKDIVGCTRTSANKFAFHSLARQFCCDDSTPEAAQARAMARTKAANGNFKPNGEYEKMQFYYHSDHLGSSSYITNLDGEVSQHVEYVPFGEVFIEERNNTWNTPYLFNAKEFDEETGMYYYGARYYEPRLSLWMSVDPMQEKYPDINSYCYTYNNPINLTDPTGMDWVEGKDGDITWRKEVNAENYSNQHDAVNLSPNPGNLVVKYVYPKDYNPTKLSLPLFNMKGRSLNMNSSR
jgi:RHS repeat-associated protein